MHLTTCASDTFLEVECSPLQIKDTFRNNVAKSPIAALLSTIKGTQIETSLLDEFHHRKWNCRGNVSHAEKDDHGKELELNSGEMKHSGAEIEQIDRRKEQCTMQDPFRREMERIQRSN